MHAKNGPAAIERLRIRGHAAQKTMNLSSPAAVSALLRRHSFLPAQKFGQNFLVDANTLAKIVAAGELEQGDAVLEIGTGLGALTRALAERVGASGRVVTVERDPRLAPLHAETLPEGDLPQVRRVSGDALQLNLPELTVSDLSTAGHRGIAVVANIPYNITSLLIARFLEFSPPLRVIVLLVQREVAERLNAGAGSSEYGAFSIFAQFYADVEVVGLVPPTIFFPPPKVTSAIIRLRPRTAPPVAVENRALFFTIVRAAFQQRRKTLLNALAGVETGWSKPEALAVLMASGIDPQRRGETLSISEFSLLESAAGSVLPLRQIL